jgi:hypothetical protein
MALVCATASLVFAVAATVAGAIVAGAADEGDVATTTDSPPAPPPEPPSPAPPPELPPAPDADGDGLADGVDNCGTTPNPDQTDIDADGLGDACDPKDDRDLDSDGDNVADAIDNCPDEANHEQPDLDGDGMGDACDSDVDGDGVSNRSDECGTTLEDHLGKNPNDGCPDASTDGDAKQDAATDSSGNPSSQKITVEVKSMPALAPPEAKQAQSPPHLDTAPPPDPTGFKSVVGEKFVTISWGSVADAKAYVATRSGGTQLAAARDTVVYEGPATTFTDRTVKKGVEYRYVVAAVDTAGNRSAGVAITVTPRAVYLVKPTNGFRVTRGRVDFRWAPVHGAGYYNLQLYRQTGRGALAAAQATKVLSAWPPKARYRLASSWKYKGKRYALSPGNYVWYIWPGLGLRAKANYGALLGQSAFVVTKRRN